MVMKKLYVLFVVLLTTLSSLYAGKVITYTATEKLHERSRLDGEGLYFRSFNYGFSGIDSHTFYDGEGTIIFSDEVTSIGYGAFKGCSSLISITIPNSVTNIGDDVFNGCTSLTSITIPNSVTSIGERAFCGCTSLASISVPNSVTSIGNAAFSGCTGLTSVTIPNSVTSIGWSAFDGCTSLTSITIPNSVTSIGDRAFRGCTGLTSITIPGSVTRIGDYAFVGCTSLTSITIPSSVTRIGIWAFYGCTGLTSVTIPNSVTRIGKQAFSGCSGLITITIPHSVTSIGYATFSDCPRLTSIIVESGNTIYDSRNNCNAIIETSTNTLIQGCKTTIIPNGVRRIGSGSFEDCTGLTSVTIPNSVNSIEQNAFDGCTGLASIIVESGNAIYDSRNNCNAIIETSTNTLIQGCKTTIIPNGVTSIGNRAFCYCNGLTSITIPNSVTSIGESAFYGCIGLTSIIVESGNTIYDSRDNCNAIIESSTNKLIQGCNTTIIPNSVTSIGSYAFLGCTGLTSVTIPNNVTSIGSFAFYGCTGLTSVTIPNSVTSIGSFAFYGCTGLTSVTIPNSVTSIGWSAFYGCTSLTSITIPNSVTSIENSAFANCTSLTSITIPSSVTSIKSSAFADCSSLTSITIPNSITNITEGAFGAFDGCSELKSVTINSDTIVNAYHDPSISSIFGSQVTEYILGDDVHSIGTNTFYECFNLTSITIPNSVTSIGNGAFERCTSLTSITIPNSVTSIGKYTFFGCSSLASITIPNSVTSIGESAFNDCTGLTSIVVGSGNTTYDSRNNCNAIIETAANTLIVGISTTIIPNSVTSIGEDAFFGCTGLTSVTIPNSVTSIGDRAFYGCTGLTSITIPNSVTSIGWEAFDDCTSLTSITSRAVTPPKCDNLGVYSDTVSVYIPCGTEEAYRNANGWNDLENYVEMFDYILTVTTLNADMGSAIITQEPSCDDNKGVFKAVANKGYRFVQWNDGNTDNPRTVFVVQDTAFVAEFAEQIPQYYITATCDPQQGVVTGAGTYDYGTLATLEAIANKGYRFAQWNDGNTDNPRTVSVVQDTAFVAEFAEQIPQYSITATCDPQQGVVTGAGAYDYGTLATLEAIAKTGYEFDSWSNGIKDNPYSFTVVENVTLKALFISTTAVDEVFAEDNTAPKKIIRDGQVYILRNGKVYTIQGQELKE